MENALGLIKEVCEEHGAKCYLVAYDTISTALEEALKPTHNSAMDAIRKAYIEGYSMGHHHTVESCYCPEQAADDWLSEQHQ